jgi:hypothetical protein
MGWTRNLFRSWFGLARFFTTQGTYDDQRHDGYEVRPNKYGRDSYRDSGGDLEVAHSARRQRSLLRARGGAEDLVCLMRHRGIGFPRWTMTTPVRRAQIWRALDPSLRWRRRARSTRGASWRAPGRRPLLRPLPSRRHRGAMCRAHRHRHLHRHNLWGRWTPYTCRPMLL